MIFLGADHAGFYLKEQIAQRLRQKGVVFEDLGTHSEKACDYPEIAKTAVKEVKKYKGKAILFCGSGEGMAMAANRFSGIRAAVVWNKDIAHETRYDNDANIASLPARFLDEDEAWEIVITFLSTPFSEEIRHIKRISQLDEK